VAHPADKSLLFACIHSALTYSVHSNIAVLSSFTCNYSQNTHTSMPTTVSTKNVSLFNVNKRIVHLAACRTCWQHTKFSSKIWSNFLDPLLYIWQPALKCKRCLGEAKRDLNLMSNLITSAFTRCFHNQTTQAWQMVKNFKIRACVDADLQFRVSRVRV